MVLWNALVVTMDAKRTIINDGAVAIHQGRIRDVGKSQALLARYPHAKHMDMRGGLLTPGLVDAHNHSAHFLTKGLLDDIESSRRWRDYLYPFESSVNEEEIYWGALGTFAEMLLHGTTSAMDPGCSHPEAVIRAADRIGIRSGVTALVSDVHDPVRPLIKAGQDVLDGGLARNEKLFLDYHGSSEGRIQVAFGLWSDSTVTDDLCVKVRRLAEHHSAMIHGHLASKPRDNDVSLERWGARAVERYDKLGVLGPNFAGVHMGAINDDDVALIQASGMNVVHAPSASMLGAFGCIAHGKFPELVQAGVNVALGTDAASISRFLDMPRVMHLAACAHKDARRDAEIMGAHRAMEMATLGGAKALGLSDSIGSIDIGKQADLVLFRMDGWEWQPRPTHNPVANLVYSSGGHRVDTVIVNGKIVVRSGRLMEIDEQELRQHLPRYSATAVKRAGIVEQTVWPTI